MPTTRAPYVSPPGGGRPAPLGPGEPLDLAILGSLADAPHDAESLVAAVRALCRPWLHPTAEVVCARIARHVDDRRIGCAAGEPGPGARA